MKIDILFLFIFGWACTIEAQIPELRFPMKTAAPYVHVAFSADSKYVLTAAPDEMILWETASGRRLRSLKVDTKQGPIGGISCSPNLEGVAIWFPGYPDPIIRLWDGLSGTTEANVHFVAQDAISASGQYMYFSTNDNGDRIDSLRVVDLKEKQTIHFPVKVDGMVYPHPTDDLKLVLLSQDEMTGKRELQFVDLRTNRNIKTAFPNDEIRHVHWIKNPARLLLIFEDPVTQKSTLKLWQPESGKWEASPGTLEGIITTTSGTSDGKRMWLLTENKSLYALDLDQKPALQLVKKRVMIPDEKRDEMDQDDDWENYSEDIFSAPYQTTPGSDLLTIRRTDSTSIQIWDVKKDQMLWSLPFNATHIRLINGSEAPGGRLAFSPDGRYILTGYPDGRLILWDSQNGNSIRTFSDGPLRAISGVNFTSEGNIHVRSEATHWSFNPRNGLFSESTAEEKTNKSEILPDGRHQLTIGGNRHWMDRLKLSNQDSTMTLRWYVWPGGDYKEANVPRLELIDHKTKKEINIAGEYSWVKTAVFSPDHNMILTGREDNTIHVIRTTDGKLIHKLEGHNSDIEEINISPDNKFAVSRARDGYELKLWDLQAGKELAALYFFVEKNWVAISPSGLFDATSQVMAQMYYVVGREMIDLDQLKERYYEPGLLSKVLGYSQEKERSVEAFTSVALYPTLKATIIPEKAILDVLLTPRNGGMGKLSVFVNGKEVMEDANPKRLTTLTVNLADFDRYYRWDTLNLISLRVYNEAGWLKSQALDIEYIPRATAKGGEGTTGGNLVSLQKNPSLYGLVIGTSDYAGTALDLQFADRDATLFSTALKAVAPLVFNDRVFITLLNTNGKDTIRSSVSDKSSIKKAFAAIAEKAKPQDVLVMYFSGHGVNYGTAENAQFYYLTKDIASENLIDPEIRNTYAISSTELTEWINAVPVLKQVLILDACNSGKLVTDLGSGARDLNSSQIRALERMKDRTGMFILTGSAGDKVSYEASRYGQGLLTYSLLEGMSGLGLTEDKRVDVMTLFQYARDKVPELARGIGGIQIPVLSFPPNAGSFDIGIVDSKVNIPIAQIKPVFIRNNFQDEDFGDALGLMKALEERLRSESIQGASATLIYVDVNEYDEGYSIRGSYKISGQRVELKASLFKGKMIITKFQLQGKKENVEGLVDALMKKISGLVEE